MGYVLAQRKNKVELVRGDFSSVQVGYLFKREPLIHGGEPWKVIKIPTREQQTLLNSLSTIMGTEKFEELMHIFGIEVEQ